MAIEKKKLLEKFEGPLNEDEQRLYDILVRASDIILTQRFNGSNSIEIEESKIDNILSALVPIRKSVFLEKWKKEYEAVGWFVSYQSEREGNYWNFK